jgi:hypothetical protein
MPNPYKGELGLHLGTPEQANEFVPGPGGYTISGARIYPLEADIKNPLRLENKGSWGFYDVADQLVERGLYTEQEIAPLKQRYNQMRWNGKDARVVWEWGYEILRDLIEDKGYDGIVYTNRSEGLNWAHTNSQAAAHFTTDRDFQNELGAQDSYIAFHPGQIHPIYS